MEVSSEPQASPSCWSPTRICSRVSVSKELLSAGSDGRGGIWEKLLINSQTNSRKKPTLQTVRIERSPSLDRVQTFLPQMAQANEKLRNEMASAPPDHFNIENINSLGEVIQMDVALFEMNQSDSKEEESSQGSSENTLESEDEDDSISHEVIVDNIKLPNSDGGKGKIEVLDSPASKKQKQ
ncbi:NOP protein chaperone 1-like [Nycticebus coucang]|uniref:NOP protein chaperone 1-like n=1 Tax=Nycticebus coucang TaxID=9470 RepID=UPI00234D5817|nr:NOP protein chaperone 1-like [Nycticebus coucang]